MLENSSQAPVFLKKLPSLSRHQMQFSLFYTTHSGFFLLIGSLVQLLVCLFCEGRGFALSCLWPRCLMAAVLLSSWVSCWIRASRKHPIASLHEAELSRLISVGLIWSGHFSLWHPFLTRALVGLKTHTHCLLGERFASLWELPLKTWNWELIFSRAEQIGGRVWLTMTGQLVKLVIIFEFHSQCLFQMNSAILEGENTICLNRIITEC